MNDAKQRLWVRASDRDGKGVIFMEAEAQEQARETVLIEMTNATLGYLYECGHHSEELAVFGRSLCDVLAKWWDERNRFEEFGGTLPQQETDDGWRVFWRPADAQVAADEADA